MFMDGETRVTLGDAVAVNAIDPPAFDGILDTPSHTVILSTVEHKTILHSAVPNIQTRVRIWTNHPTEPDQVLIGLG